MGRSTLWLVTYLTTTMNGLVFAAGLDDWSSLLSKGEAAETAGDYNTAIRELRRALAVASASQTPDLETFATLDKLAGAYSAAGQFAEAGHQWHLALKMAEKMYGPHSLSYGAIVASLAALPTEENNSATNTSILARVAAANASPPFSRNVVVVRLALAQLLMSQNNYTEAEVLLAATTENLQTSVPVDLQLRAEVFGAYGALRQKQSRFAEAAELTRTALRLLESALGKYHPLLVMPLNNLAVDLVKAGDYGAALDAFQRAASLCADSLAGNRLACGIAFENVSISFRRMGRKREAKVFAARAAEILHESALQNGLGMTIAAGGQALAAH